MPADPSFSNWFGLLEDNFHNFNGEKSSENTPPFSAQEELLPSYSGDGYVPPPESSEKTKKDTRGRKRKTPGEPKPTKKAISR